MIGAPVQPALDPVIHPAKRLQLCAALSAASQVEFSAVQRAVQLSPSALSKQVHTLIDAGYVLQRRDLADSRRIWLRLTPAGRSAYRSHLAALQALIDMDGGVDDDDSDAEAEAEGSWSTA